MAERCELEYSREMEMYTNLKGDETQGHHTEPYHRQGVFTSEKTRIEETKTRCHHQDESRRSNAGGELGIVRSRGCVARWIRRIDDGTRGWGRSVGMW